MNQNRLDYLKRVIKRNFKRYTKERTDAESTIKDITDFFNIPIDEERLDDYIVQSIDFKIPSIEVFDKKENTTHKAEYTACATLLNFYTDAETPRYISLISDGPKGKIESLYYIGNKDPIISEMAIQSNNDDYEIVIQKQRPNTISTNSSGGHRLRVRYLQNSELNNEKIQNTLLGKTFTRFTKNEGHYNCDSFLYSSLFTYGDKPMYKTQMGDSQHKYTFVREQGIVYGIEELMLKPEGTTNTDVDLQGFCCETTEDLEQFISNNFDADHYKGLGTSALVFIGNSDFSDDRDRLKRHVLEISKNDENIIINYNCVRGVYGIHETDYDEHLMLQNSTDGKISTCELDEICQTLSKKFPVNNFIDAVVNEINNFKDQINIRKGLKEEELDLLDPELLIDKPIDEIYSMISSNKEDYFKIIEEQFYNATHISAANKPKKAYTKTPTTSGNSSSN